MPLTNRQVQTLLQATLRGDPQDVINTFAAVADQFSAAKSNGDIKLWLKEMATQIASQLDLGGKMPSRGRTVASPASPVKADVRLSDLRLAPAILELLHLVIAERCNIAALREHNLKPTRAMLLCGPSGTGKTSIAKALAAELDCPLRMESAATLIESYLGSSAKRIREVFAEISRGGEKKTAGLDFSGGCVLLLDECEVLLHGRKTHGSLVREENSITAEFLQCLDSLNDSCLVIGTTNHPEMIDSAMFRRFQHVVEIGLPGRGDILKHARTLARKHKIPEDLLSLGDFGHSYATCEREVERLARAWVLKL